MNASQEGFNPYVLGFLFKEDKSSVVLIRKEKPEWQRGLLNGVGGKVEQDESYSEAIVREFREETGVETLESKWEFFAQMHGPQFLVCCFKTFDDAAYNNVMTVTDEKIERVDPRIFRNDCISNLNWLIQMAMDDNYGRQFVARIDYF